jgi:haloalkane dehalogenase
MRSLVFRTALVAGARTTYLDEGSGPPVLLLHGAPFTALGFVRMIRELRKNHRVIAPDLPGFGGSELPAGFPGTLASYSTFVVELCRTLGLEQLVIYVSDASGCFGLAAASEMAEKVRGLVVAGTAPIPLTGAASIVRFVLTHVIGSRLVRFLNKRFNLFPWMVATVAPWLRPFSRDERRMLTSAFDGADKRERVIDLFENMGRDQRFMAETASHATKRLAHKPALLLFGQFDPMRLIGGVGRFRRIFPGAAVSILPWEEHFPQLSSGEKVGRIVHDWIAGSVEGESV